MKQLFRKLRKWLWLDEPSYPKDTNTRLISLARTHNAKLVYINTGSDVYMTYAQKSIDQNGVEFMWAHTLWQSEVGYVVLNADGTIDKERSEYQHLKHWLPVNEEERVAMLLTYDHLSQ